MTDRLRLLVPTLLLAAACGPKNPPANGATTSVTTSSTSANAGAGAAAAGDAGARGDTTVALAPTRDDELPAAVLGTAPPPRGAPIAYFADDPAAKGYLAIPRGGGRHPAVILIHEWNGLNDRVRQVADAMAAEGYVALAVDLYSGREGHDPQENVALMQAIRGNMPRVIANLDAAARYLRGRGDVTGRIATIGWCMGGGIALSYGIEGQHHEGTAMFYGMLVQDPAKLARMRHPLYGSFAGKDERITPDSVRQFVEALRAAGIQNDVHVYDDMEHGFWLWVDRDPNRRGPALDAWTRLKKYLATTLRA